MGTIDRERDAMPHMKAIVFCRANSANLRLLADELKTPKHSQYHIFLSNIAPPVSLAASCRRRPRAAAPPLRRVHPRRLPPPAAAATARPPLPPPLRRAATPSQSFLDQLAKADVHSRVEQVREYYADYSAVAPELFSLNLRSASLMCKPAAGPYGSLTMEEATFQRSLDGVMSVLLAHKLRPAIRFQGTSPLAGHFARAVDSSIGSQRELFGLMPHSSPSPLLLVLDRKEDPVTPLLTQWTYQAMVHETIGLWSNKVDLPPSTSGAAGQKVVLDPVHDDFFAEHMYSHFTVFAEAVQARLKEYEAKHKTTGSISSIEDMRRALERLPALRRARDNVSKHVAIMSELDRRVRNHKLFELTVLEQDLAEQDALSRHFEEVSALIADPAVRAFDALRLVMIFALRYEVDGSRQVSELKVALASRGIEHGSVALVDALLEYAGVRARGGDLFSKKSVIARVRRGVSRSLKGIDSAITNHKPLLSDILAGERACIRLAAHASAPAPPAGRRSRWHAPVRCAPLQAVAAPQMPCSRPALPHSRPSLRPAPSFPLPSSTLAHPPRRPRQRAPVHDPVPGRRQGRGRRPRRHRHHLRRGRRDLRGGRGGPQVQHHPGRHHASHPRRHIPPQLRLLHRRRGGVLQGRGGGPRDPRPGGWRCRVDRQGIGWHLHRRWDAGFWERGGGPEGGLLLRDTQLRSTPRPSDD